MRVSQDAERLLAWLKRSKHRLAMFEAVLAISHRGKGVAPTGRQAMNYAQTDGRLSGWQEGKVSYYHQSCISNGYAAIRQLVEAGLLARTDPDHRGLSPGPMLDLFEEDSEAKQALKKLLRCENEK